MEKTTLLLIAILLFLTSPTEQSPASALDQHQSNVGKPQDDQAGRETRSLKGHKGLVRSVAFSADGEMLACGSYDQTVKLWDVQTGQEIRSLKGHGRISSVAFSADGRMLASGSYDQTVKLWDLQRHP